MARNIEAFKLRTELVVDATKASSEYKKAEASVTHYGETVKKVAKDTGKAFDGEKAGKKWGSDFGASAVTAITGSFDSLGQTLGSIIGTAAAPGLGTAIGSTVGSGIDKLLSTAAGPIKQLIGQGIELNKLLEDTQFEFTRFAGSAAEGKKYLDDLLDMSRELGVLPQTLIQASERAYDLTGNLKLTKLILKAANDQAVDFNVSVDELVNSMGQLALRGEDVGRSLKQLYKQGINPYERLAEMTGRSVKSIKELAAQGRIRGESAATLIAASIEKEKGGYAAARAAQTLSGQQARFTVNTILLAQKATANFSDTLRDLLKQVNTVLAGPGADKVVTFLNDFVQTVRKGTEGALSAGMAAGPSFIQGMLNPDPAAMMKSVQGLVGLMGQLFKAVLGIQSPSQWAIDQIGIPIGQGIADGIKQGFLSSELERAFQKILTGKLRPIIDEAAKQFGIAPEIIAAVIAQESRGQAGAVSPVGAKGLMQLMPGTAARHGVTNIFDPRQNIFGGTAELADLFKQFPGDLPAALAHYNWSGRGQMPTETKNYVRSITGLLGMGDVGAGAGAGQVTINVQGGDTGIAGKPGYRMEDVYPEIDQFRNQISQLNEKSAALFETMQWYQENLKDWQSTVRGQELQKEYAETTKKVEELNLALANFIKAHTATTTEKSGVVAPLWFGGTKERSGVAAAVSLSRELPIGKPTDWRALYDAFKGIKIETKSLDPALAGFRTNMALLEMGLPVMSGDVKELTAANKEAAASTEDVTKAVKNFTTEAETTSHKLLGAFEQAAGQIPSQQVGKKRSLWSKILGIAAPFVSLIPGFGPGIAALLGTMTATAGHIVGGEYGAAVSTAAGGIKQFQKTRSEGDDEEDGGGGGTQSAGWGSFTLPPIGGSLPGRARGGPVYRGRPYLVGEYQPEVFVPGQSGYVQPMGGAGGGNLVALLERLHATLNRFDSMPADHVVMKGARGMLQAMDTNAALADGYGRRLRLA